MGDSIDAPSPEQMRAMLDELDDEDEEHGAAWLGTEDGTSLEWSVDGRLVLCQDGTRARRHLAAVSREQTLELWCALARGDVAYVTRQPWKDGSGYVETPEHRAEMQRWQLEQYREFYDALGTERSDPKCRRDGCIRGAIEQSALCRVHHFESVKGRPSPFSH